jgi:site-specific DNA recombinase
VWQAIEAVLQQPGLIAAAVSRQEATADQQRAGVQQELLTLESALAKCDREAQRWAEAYAVEVITIRELKGYRAKIEARCQSLLTQQATCQAQLEAMGQAVRQVEALTGYCARVRRRLQTFDSAEKQLAFEALNIGVMWSPGLPLAIEGTIPFDTIAPTSAPRQRCSLPRRASWRDARV